MPVFITVYSALFVSGDVVLSDEHGLYEWVTPKEAALFTEADFGNSEEHLAMRKVFSTLSEVR